MKRNLELELQLREECLVILNPYIKKLKRFNVDAVGYRDFTLDGKSLTFCSYKGWYNVQYNSVLLDEMSYHYAKEIAFLQSNNYDSVMRSTNTSIDNGFLHELLNKNMCNSFIIYKSSPKLIRLYAFLAHTDNISAIHHMVNNKKELESYINEYDLEIQKIVFQEKYKSLRHELFSTKTAKVIFENYLNFNKGKVFYEGLTEREVECVYLLREGATNKDIARKLDISVKTAEYHVHNIKKKLKVSSRFDIKNMIQE